MSRIKLEQAAAEMHENVREILQTAKAVKGERFAQAAAMLFELMSIQYLGLRMTGYINDGRANEFRANLMTVVTSLGEWLQIALNLPADDFQEALDLACRMADRQEELQARVEGQQP